jgi:hypothetical protein
VPIGTSERNSVMSLSMMLVTSSIFMLTSCYKKEHEINTRWLRCKSQRR